MYSLTLAVFAARDMNICWAYAYTELVSEGGCFLLVMTEKNAADMLVRLLSF
jgi:hypothetical protein